MNVPIRLAPAQAWRSYRGGKLIAALHGAQAQDSFFPEEWLLSTVVARNPGREDIVEGLSVVEETGVELREYLKQDPEGLLGKGRQETGLLMKLIDSAERLPVQAHPSREKAMRYFHSPFGKTECWHILGGREIDGEKPCIYFGFREGVTRELWTELFHRQDIQGMLDCLHRIEVQPGETYLIRGGVPHAIGAGCFLAEIQEPTDLTLRTECNGPDGERLPDDHCHLGIGFENMLDCFDYDGCSLDEARRRWQIPPRLIGEEKGEYRRTALLSYDDTPYFRMEKDEVAGKMEVRGQPQFHGLYFLKGTGTIRFADKTGKLFPGVQYFVPADAETYTILCDREPIELLRYEGPKL